MPIFVVPKWASVVFPGQATVFFAHKEWALKGVELATATTNTLCLLQPGSDMTPDALYGIIARITDTREATMGNQPGTEVTLHATHRCRISELRLMEEGTPVVDEVEVVEDATPLSAVDLIRGREYRAIQPVMTEAKERIDVFMKKHRHNSLWKSMLLSAGAPDYASCSALGFWLCAVMSQSGKMPHDVAYELLVSTSAPQRLRKAFSMFKETPPISSTAQVNKYKDVTTMNNRMLQRLGGHVSPKNNDAMLSLREIALRTIEKNIIDLHPYLVTADAVCLQLIVDRLNQGGSTTKETLMFLKECMAVRSIFLIGEQVQDDWLLEDLCHEGFAGLTELQLLACHRLSDDSVNQTLRRMANLNILSVDRSKRIGDGAFIDALGGLREIRQLWIGGTRVTRRTIDIAATLPKLQDVDVSCLFHFDDDCALALFGPNSACAGQLTSVLASTVVKLTEVGAALLTQHPNLRTLSLSFNSKIADWSFLGALTRLTDLDISLNYLVNDTTMEIIGNNLLDLEYLYLAKTDVSNACCDSLAKLTKLRVLDLGRTDVGDGILRGLAALTNLQVLLLPYTNVSSAAGHVLGGLPLLRVLKLTSCLNFSDHGLRDLSESDNACARIVSLDVGGQGITSDCVAFLTRFRNLESLQLWETRMTYPSAQSLAQQTGLVIDDQIRCTPGTWLFSCRKSE